MTIDFKFYFTETIFSKNSGYGEWFSKSALINGIGNILMYPTQQLFGSGKVYHVHYPMKDENSGEIPFHLDPTHDDYQTNHTSFYEETNKVIRAVNALIGILHTILCVYNLAGIAIKWLFQNHEIKRNYELTKIAIEEDHPMVSRKGMALAPPLIKPNEDELEAIKSIEIKELVTIWDKVGETNNHHNRNKLEMWLTETVPYPEKYNYIHQTIAPQAATQLQQNLRLIIHQMNIQPDLSNDAKERLILEIAEALTCSPTWLETTNRVYQKLKGGGSGKDYILEILRRIKEDIILDETQLGYDADWHGLNIARQVAGKALGLDRSKLSFDNTFKFNAFASYMIGIHILERFFEICSAEELIRRFIEKIASENQGPKANGLDQKLTPLLNELALKHANDQIKKFAEKVAQTLEDHQNIDFETALNSSIPENDPKWSLGDEGLIEDFISNVLSDRSERESEDPSSFIRDCATKFAILDEDLDEGNYVENAFFTKISEEKYELNKEGARSLLQIVSAVS